MSEFISNHLRLEVNRNIMFLLCNSILLFVTGGFGFFRASSNGVDDLRGEYLSRSAAQHRSVPIEDKEVIVESMVLAVNGITDKEVIVTDAEEEEEEANGASAGKENNYHQHHLYQHHQTHNHHRRSRPNDHHHHHHHQRHGCQYRRQHRKQQQQRHHPQRHQPREEEEEKGQENYYRQQEERDRLGGLMIVEESDERFDNFIKQVKEGIRMEARQLLLTA